MKSCLNDGCRRVTRINVSPRVLKLTRSEFLNQNYRSLYGVLSVGRFCSHSIKCVAVTTRYISVVYTQQQRESVLNCTVKSKYTHTHTGGRAFTHSISCGNVSGFSFFVFISSLSRKWATALICLHASVGCFPSRILPRLNYDQMTYASHMRYKWIKIH